MKTAEELHSRGFVFVVSEFSIGEKDVHRIGELEIGTAIQFSKGHRRISLRKRERLQDDLMPVGVNLIIIEDLFRVGTYFTIQSNQPVKVITLTKEEEIKLIPYTA